jgi:hypothetical protein
MNKSKIIIGKTKLLQGKASVMKLKKKFVPGMSNIKIRA